MSRFRKPRASIFIWLFILIFLFIIITFPRWITVFYPQPHKDLIFSSAYEYQIDPYLIFSIIRAESKFQTTAESPVGAKGLMQIMPDTALWIAEQRGVEDFQIDELHKPEINIDFGCWYLASLKKEFDGQLPIVIAAYNAGRGKVVNWIEVGQWDGTEDNVEQIPFSETRKYVKNVLKNYQAYHAIYNS
ncbi:Soluble lytic murein transglycosylase [Candidatus Syntrophocurvum alkaliphilum]|uniref:Soluble lytic murein transglycosylase n=1 Tax=Candidatus Syntrophocurvum alkaliphilum TaxID=2293317 RepID=A0A6I6DGF0_9FIRM|nr:lytic transglycosylase domain-containing protein [Candidatus Syntrophocurvum alkaliphilum]QGU00177.1 Soluble lytic murein transglycosylase [Candidatus Syntrophocurvum alkaliphilum]